MAFKPDQADDIHAVELASDISAGTHDVGETHLLPPGATRYLLNIPTALDGGRQKRLGAFPRGSPGVTLSPNGAFSFESPLDDFRHVVVQQGSALYSTDGTTESFTPRATTASLYNTIHAGAQGRAMDSASNPIAALFLASSVSASDNASQPYDKLFVLNRNWAFSSVSYVWPHAVTWFQNRLWAWGDVNRGEDALSWSAILDGQNWEHGNFIRVDPDAGDRATAITPLRGDAGRMLLFKERSVHLLSIFWDTDGFFPGSQNQLDFTTAQVRPVVSDTGCVGPRALTWVPGLQGGDLLFLSREGIRSLNRSATDAQGGAGLPLSWRIQTQIDRINWAHADRSTAVFWDNVAYFAVPVDGSETPNFVLAYFVPRDSFYYLDWSVNAWVKSQIDPARKLYFFHQSTASDGQSTVTLGHHLYEAFRGTQDPGKVAVNYEEQTRAFSMPTDDFPGSGLRNRKIWRWLELRALGASTAASLAIQYKVDDGNDWLTYRNFSVDPSDSYPSLPVQLPFTFDAGKIVRRSLSLHSIAPGRKLQLRFLDSASYGRIKILDIQVAATILQETFS